ncbi:MAG TPA: hypothetical protein VJB14_00785, partial [Planctomycetota bacterium]|nr:hypothetical protein [Planctomycetota bacterium]
SVSAFDRLGLPDVKGARLVLYNTGRYDLHSTAQGPRIVFTIHFGWLLSESRDEVTLYRNRLVVRTHRRAWTPPEQWSRLRESLPADRPLPGEWKEVDFEAFCRDLLKEPKWDYKGDHRHFSNSWHDAYALEPALYAWWAFQRGLDRIGLELVALGDRSIRQRPGEPGETRRLQDLVADALPRHLREQAITDAKELVPRGELLERWKKIAALQNGPASGEAARMISRYAALLEEDAAWVEPTPGALAGRSPRVRAEYWVHKLRDHAPGIASQPGACWVLPWLPSLLPKGQANAARELEKLGWAALPVLIDHFDDPRLTRAACFSTSSHGVHPSWLLSVGDCSQIVFDAITRLDYSVWETAAYASDKKEKSESAKARAEAWWKAEGVKGSAHHYLSLLESKTSDGTAYIAARKLIESDPDSGLRRVIELARTTTDWPRRRSLFYAASPFLGSDHREFLESSLQDPEDTWEVVGAARLLWEKCGSEDGVRHVIDRMERLLSPPEGFGERFCRCCFLRETEDLLAGVPRDFVAVALARFLKSPLADVRDMALRAAWRFPHPTVAGALAALLKDRTPFPGAQPGIRVFLESKGSAPRCEDARLCDVAAAALARAVGFAPCFPEEASLKERDRSITAIGSWWESHRNQVRKGGFPCTRVHLNDNSCRGGGPAR